MQKLEQLKIFIISWQGQHDQALRIANAVGAVVSNISIVYSDPAIEFTFDQSIVSINRPNNLFWADKFKACLDNCHSELMLVIHADCACDDWSALVYECNSAMQKHSEIGVWSPNIEGTPFELAVTRLTDVENTNMSVVANTDAIIFCLSKRVQDRMRRYDYSANVYGWGIDVAFCTFCFAVGLLVIVDRSIFVQHSKSRGYSKLPAKKQMEVFLTGLTQSEKIQYLLLRFFINKKKAEQT